MVSSYELILWRSLWNPILFSLYCDFHLFKNFELFIKNPTADMSVFGGGYVSTVIQMIRSWWPGMSGFKLLKPIYCMTLNCRDM